MLIALAFRSGSVSTATFRGRDWQAMRSRYLQLLPGDGFQLEMLTARRWESQSLRVAMPINSEVRARSKGRGVIAGRAAALPERTAHPQSVFPRTVVEL